MKKLLPFILIFLFVGGVIGAGILWIYESDTADGIKTFNETDLQQTEEGVSVAELEKENAELKLQLEVLKKQLDQLAAKRLSQNAVMQQIVSNEATEAQKRKLKKQWLEDMLSNENTRGFARRSERELNRMIQGLGLTPDQATEVSLLLEKRDEQRKLEMMRSMGLISEEEYNSMFAELSAFNFDLALNSLLSPEQQLGLDSMQSEQRERGSERITQMMASRLNLNDTERFSESERTAISDAIKTAMDRSAQLEVPPAIRELDINRLDKRILAAGYQQLDSESFEKLYQSVVEENEGGNGVFIGGGGRRPPPPPGE